ncbi:hypothetical protein [Candidatus Mycobacterium methanotrophicum]|uniref:Uncharacterized protein n=1 Tax=Candidatus Mycobacterium methanotrophicum TaxID=2943498 RepID=A0ABY4QGG2_9MYCO|nr:hypothetical protein [Candidatus Mycobacterium methanotrophicum]UQX09322.1 hypothetical protein M5I08_12775 [Candidatus Mycobacterium methanotrophicum]
MDFKRLAAASAALVTSIGIPALTGGVPAVSAAPLDPPPVDPGGSVVGPGDAPPSAPPPLHPFEPRPPVMRVGPGGPKGGGGQPSYEQPHRVPAPPPGPVGGAPAEDPQ